ncbi:General transcription factor IIH subunit putative, variant 2 [Balamuthia mandrillaris]
MNALELTEGEEVVLQSDAKHQKREGTLILTNHRLIFCRAATNEVMVQIPLKDLHSHFVSKSAAPPLYMKVMTEEDERRRIEEESKKKPNVRERTTRKKKTFGRVFEFTSRLGPESAFGERDGFRDLIAQFVPLHKKLAQEEAEAEEEVNRKKRTREEEDSEEATKLEMDLMQVMEKAEEEQRQQQQTKKARMEEQRQRGKPMVERVGEKAKLRLEEAKQRAALLAGNDTLRALHDELVISGIISEEEFWSSRKQMLETEAQSVAKQQRGMSSELLADVKPALETCNAVHYRLTPTVIRQIFVEYPAVKKAYEEWVPDKLSETEFWTKYFQSQYFHKSRGGGSSSASASSSASGRPKEVMDSSVYSADEVFAGCAEEDDELIQEDSARLGAKVKHVEITSNLALARDTLITDDGYGNVSDSVVGPTAPKASRALTLLRRYNRHGALVLGTDRSLLSGGGSSSSLSSATNNSQLAKRLQDKMKEEEEKEKEKEKQKEEAKKRSVSPPPQRNKENGIREAAKDGRNHNHGASLNKQVVQQSTEWTELEERKEEQVVELNITDQRRYFEGHTSTGILGDSDVRTFSFLYALLFSLLFLPFVFYF